MPVVEIISTLNERYGLKMPVEEVSRREEERYFASLSRLRAVPEVLEHIEDQYGRIPFAVVSGSTRDSVVASLEALAILDRFDTLVTDGGLGVAYHVGPQSVQVKVQLEDYRLDNDAFRSLYGMLAQYQYALSDLSALSGYAQVSQLDYHLKGQPDALRYTLGAGYSQALSRTAVFYGGLYGGQEKSDVSDIGLGQNFYGLRLGGSLALSNALRLTSGLSVEKRKFDGTDKLFLVTRDDTETDLSLGAVYEPAPHFSIRPNYAYTNSNSNIALSNYDRHVVSVDFRYEL